MPEPIRIQSTRFGALEITPERAIEFPLGLVGLPGTAYTLLEHRPGGDFRWLHSLEHPALALPVIDPRPLFPDFALTVAPEDQERTGLADISAAELYVTVRVSTDPAEVTANLRAPLVILHGRGFQVINIAPGQGLRAPLVSAQSGTPGARPELREDAA